LRDAEAILEERGLGDAAIVAAAEKAAELVEPMSDQHGSADYRRHLTGVLTRRAVHKAITERGHA
jgi:carbon-monoxide dehydrogenase medium subunit